MEQYLAVLDRLLVLDQGLDDDARAFGLDFVVELHGFDETDDRLRRDLAADLDERRLARFGGRVERARAWDF